MIEQPQTKLKKAEIAPVSAMDDLVPAMSQGIDPEVDNPQIGETSGDQESTQARRV